MRQAWIAIHTKTASIINIYRKACTSNNSETTNTITVIVFVVQLLFELPTVKYNKNKTFYATLNKAPEAESHTSKYSTQGMAAVQIVSDV